MNFKRILSWDVGIKNLAYCLIQKTDDDFKILKWGVINLVDDRQKCEYHMKNGNQCSEPARLCIYHTDKIPIFDDNTNEMKYVCTKHKDKMMPKIIDVDDIKLKQKKKFIPHKCNNCTDESDYDLDGTSYCWCETHYEKKGKSFVKKIKSKKVTIVSCNRQPIQELCEKLFSRLDNEKDFLTAETVLIENQPSFRNPTMKTISSILYSYFVLRGVIDKNITKSNICDVRFVSPSNKLKIDAEKTKQVLSKDKKEVKSKIYALTKGLGVKYCRSLISKPDDDILGRMKKKDDMCDAFLQGFQFLFSPVPDKYFKKLQEIGLNDKTVKNKKVKKDN